MQHQSVEDGRDFILNLIFCPVGVPTIGYMVLLLPRW